MNEDSSRTTFVVGVKSRRYLDRLSNSNIWTTNITNKWAFQTMDTAASNKKQLQKHVAINLTCGNSSRQCGE